jgi:hypothetical protein
MPFIGQPIKIKKVNIGTEETSKLANVGDYWDVATIDKITELLHEYQDLFPTKFTDMKGIKGPMGEMRIPLKPDSRPVKHRPYRLNPKYKEKVNIELDRILEVRIIEPVEESEFLHKFLEAYFDDWTVFSLLKNHIECLRLMLDKCRQCQIALNLKKCILFSPFGVLLGHIVCKQGLLVDPSKIPIIVDLPPPITVKQLRTVLGHTCYYKKFIKGYAQITTPMEKPLKKDCQFSWTEECQQSLDTLKEKMVTTPILFFPDWTQEFHVHVDASSIALGVVLAQLGEGDIDHPLAFASRKLSTTEINYTTTEREGLAMVYALQKFRHYLLGGHFKMFIDHSALKYLVNKPVLGG